MRRDVQAVRNRQHAHRPAHHPHGGHRHRAAEAYRAETCGQQLVARVDAQLAQSKASGADRAAALDALSGKLSGISSVVSTSDVTAIARVDGSKVEATITTTGGRTLTVTINVTDDLTCDVSAWRLAAVSADEKDATTLWGGPGTN